MNQGFAFSEMMIRDKKAADCELIYQGSNSDGNNYRLYVDRFTEGQGFYALAVEFVSCSGDTKSVWDCPHLMVDEVFRITAYFDGVRHLEFKRDYEGEAGYLYYPDMKALAEMFLKVRECEITASESTKDGDI